MKCPALGILYAFFCMAASFGMGSMVQANAISESLAFAFDLPAGFIGLVLAVLSGRILFGGIGKIAGAAARLVPVSALLYMAAALGVLFVYRENLVSSFVLILTDAFSFHSAAGGALGYGISRAVRYGIARGVFSNEAGLGSMAILNGGVGEAAPGSQGQWAIFEVFFDTIISCTLTALVILCVMGEELGRFWGNGADLTGFCFAEGLGNPGGYAVSVCVTLFAFATIIAWYSYPYLCFYLAAVFVGSLGPMEQVWGLSDIFNGLMAVPNLIALIVLSGTIYRPKPPAHS